MPELPPQTTLPQKERNEGRIICGDCLQELKKLPDSSIDSVVTDPP